MTKGTKTAVRRGDRRPGAKAEPEHVCERYHHAVELIGRRWSGAILSVLLRGAKGFNELLAAVPGLSDRLLAARL
jgi:DNA-binding HxlR family transcriptional regulator